MTSTTSEQRKLKKLVGSKVSSEPRTITTASTEMRDSTKSYWETTYSIGTRLSKSLIREHLAK